MKKYGFKRALFGYSKRSVCEYIADKDQQYAQAFTEKTAALEKTIRELKQRIAELEQQNDRLRSRIYAAFGDIPDQGNPQEEMNSALESEQQKSMEAVRSSRKTQLKRLELYESRIREARRELREIMTALSEYFEGEVNMLDKMKKEIFETDDRI